MVYSLYIVGDQFPEYALAFKLTRSIDFMPKSVNGHHRLSSVYECGFSLGFDMENMCHNTLTHAFLNNV